MLSGKPFTPHGRIGTCERREGKKKDWVREIHIAAGM